MRSAGLRVVAAFVVRRRGSRVPASSPAQVGHGFVDLRITLGDSHVVRHGDCALLGQKGLRRSAANLVGGLRVDTADSGQRIDAIDDAGVGGGKEDEALGTYVAHDAVADAVGRR